MQNIEAPITCRLCGATSTFAFKKKILSRYEVGYYRCNSCESLQTEDPYWLEEAYNPLNEQFDTGQLMRCINNAAFINVVLSALNLDRERILDYGCGSGLLVRLLRDIGLDAWGHDGYSLPRLAMGFHTLSLTGHKIINLSEVVEHFDQPRKYFDEIFGHHPEIVIIQTEIFSNHDPSWASMDNTFFFFPKKLLNLL
jgi:hypothetical protein